ncbi:MAG: hypothetical protein AB7P49_19610, partial [Bdellovibrionales bacterium]
MPLLAEQDCVEFGEQTLATQAPFCKLNPELHAVKFPQVPQAVPLALQDRVPVPLLAEQDCVEFGEQTLATQTPFCKLNPELHAVRFPQLPHAVPLALQDCVPVPLLAEQDCVEFGEQTLATQTPFCKLNPEFQDVVFPQLPQADPLELQECVPV